MAAVVLCTYREGVSCTVRSCAYGLSDLSVSSSPRRPTMSPLASAGLMTLSDSFASLKQKQLRPRPGSKKRRKGSEQNGGPAMRPTKKCNNIWTSLVQSCRSATATFGPPSVLRTARPGRVVLPSIPEDPLLSRSQVAVIEWLGGTTSREQRLVAKAKTFGLCMGRGIVGSSQKQPGRSCSHTRTCLW